MPLASILSGRVDREITVVQPNTFVYTLLSELFAPIRLSLLWFSYSQSIHCCQAGMETFKTVALFAVHKKSDWFPITTARGLIEISDWAG